MRAAEASVQQESLGVGVARGDVLPSLSFDYFYGINANQFAMTDPEGHRLLGSVAQVQLTCRSVELGRDAEQAATGAAARERRRKAS